MLAPGQQTTAPAPNQRAQAGTQTAGTSTSDAEAPKTITGKDRSRAAKLFLRPRSSSSKSSLTMRLRDYQQAVANWTRRIPTTAGCSESGTKPCRHGIDPGRGQGADRQRLALQNVRLWSVPRNSTRKTHKSAQHLCRDGRRCPRRQTESRLRIEANSLGNPHPGLCRFAGKHSFHLQAQTGAR